MSYRNHQVSRSGTAQIGSGQSIPKALAERNLTWHWFTTLFLWLVSFSSQGQLISWLPHDSTYFKAYDGYLTGRLYLSRKFTALALTPNSDIGSTAKYRPNTNLNLGVGATYDWVTLNLAYGFKFLNEGKSDRGETKYIDLQTHLYPRRFAIDFFGQFYQGYYLEMPPTPDGKENYYIRPDIAAEQVAVHAEYLFNWRRFSFRAAMLQSERQLKSAGTFTAGFLANYSHLGADSSFFPGVPPYMENPLVTSAATVQFGPSGGYAYTLVLAQRIFVTAALSAQLNANFSYEKYYDESRHMFSVTPSVIARAAAGFNRPRWSVSLTWINQNTHSKNYNYGYRFISGNARANIAYRFIAGPKLRKKLRFIDDYKPWFMETKPSPAQ